MIETMSSFPSAEGLPAVDERLVAPRCGYEIIDGRVVEVPGCDEPHGTRHAKLTALLEACVVDDYAVAVDMLTRTSKIDDFAPDASVFPRARDPKTGGRMLEELAFEVLSTQTLGDVETKARKLAHRGVRRVFAIDIRRERVWEWVRDADTWQVQYDAGLIEDRCLAVPIAVAELVSATRADDAIARVLLARRHPVIEAAITERAEEGRKQGREEGRKQGREEGELTRARRALLAIADARGLPLGETERARIDACSDPAQLEAWLRRAATAHDARDILD